MQRKSQAQKPRKTLPTKTQARVEKSQGSRSTTVIQVFGVQEAEGEREELAARLGAIEAKLPKNHYKTKGNRGVGAGELTF